MRKRFKFLSKANGLPLRIVTDFVGYYRMTTTEFSNLSINNKQNVIAQYGKLLINCFQGKFLIELFGVHNIFVKVVSYDGGIKEFMVYQDLMNLKLFEIPVLVMNTMRLTGPLKS